VGVLCFLVYMANFRVIGSGDTFPARYLPFAILGWQTVLLDPLEDIAAQGRRPSSPRKNKSLPKSVDPEPAYWVVRVDGGHAVSLYPPVVPLLVAPLYLPAAAYLEATDWNVQRLDRVARIMEKVSAAIVTAPSAALFFVLVRRRATTRPALLLTA